MLVAGGTIDQDWPIEKALAVGENAQTVDLDAVWKDLGVLIENGVLVLDNKAPLASIREANYLSHFANCGEVTALTRQ